MSAVFVTGGAGYIGSQVAADLLKAGYSVTILDNLSTGVRDLVPSGAEFVQGDLEDAELVNRILSGKHFQWAAHFAASTRVDESVQAPLKYYNNNSCGTVTLLKALKDNQVKGMVFSSTAAVYGDVKHIPVSETQLPAPVSPYGKAKWFSEEMIQDFANSTSDFRFVILRYFNVAGADPAGERGQRTPNATHLIKVVSEVATGKRPSLEIFGNDYPTADGTCIRDFIHVCDLSQAHVLAIRHLEKGGASGIYNAGYGHGFSIKQVIQSFEKTTAKKIPFTFAERRAGDIVEIIADNTKIKSELGFKPQFDNLDVICKTAYDFEQSLGSR